METIAAALAAYILGSVSFAVVVSRTMRMPDPRTYGSRNPGATNVLRSGNKAAAVCTLAGDLLKGWFAVWLAQRYAPEGSVLVAVAAVTVVAGHMYPVFHRFAGGKGVSTAAGVLLALNPWLGLGTLATWLVIAAFFRISSLAALVAAAFAPFFTAILFHVGHPYFWAVAALSALLVLRHRQNIVRLIAGTEGRLGKSREESAGQGG